MTTVGRAGPSLSTALIGFAGIEPGMRALDVGCGPGALTAALDDAYRRGVGEGPFPLTARAWAVAGIVRR